jgi:alpha-mannosidase
VFEYSIIPHAGSWVDAFAHREAFNFGTGMMCQSLQPVRGSLPDAMSFVRIEPEELVLSAIKRSEDKAGIILRFYNISNRTVKGIIKVHRSLLRVDLVSMNEELLEPLALEDDMQISIPVTPKKIVSLKLTYR